MTLPPAAKSFLEALAAGDRRAYGLLYERLGDRLLRVADAMLRSMKIDGGLTFAQIAGVLKVSPNTAASRYRYALAKLRERLGEQS
jgi:DNA-directed RNA polymerase specialized sigma24 family protein